MAERKLTLEQVREQIEQQVIDTLLELDDVMASAYEINCWDSCLDGKDWNNTVKTITDMYVNAIISDRDWDGAAKEYKQAIDITPALERKRVEGEIKQLERKLKDMA